MRMSASIVSKTELLSRLLDKNVAVVNQRQQIIQTFRSAVLLEQAALQAECTETNEEWESWWSINYFVVFPRIREIQIAYEWNVSCCSKYHLSRSYNLYVPCTIARRPVSTFAVRKERVLFQSRIELLIFGSLTYSSHHSKN